MKSAWTWYRALFVVSLTLTGSGCPGNAPAPEDLCAKMVECGAGGTEAECVTQLQQMKDVLRSSAWASLGNCMLDLSCAQLEAEGSMDCLNRAMATGDPNAADGLLAAYCQKMIDCGQAPGMSVQVCVDTSKAQAGEYLGAYGMFRDSVLRCIEDCAQSQTCETLDQTFDVCLEPCGMNFGTSTDIGCDHGYEDTGECICDPGWDGTYCDQCADGYELDEYDDCVPA